MCGTARRGSWLTPRVEPWALLKGWRFHLYSETSSPFCFFMDKLAERRWRMRERGGLFPPRIGGAGNGSQPGYEPI